ncbi:DinB family protein [Nocardioides sp. AX2bis]|uniref:DinB family protein n=1 Tax=Nocardioides sp. AX2bis TaxID=2653157 RepID=UPI0012EFFFDA|nr:DinB family protein [Nocardioides sp. AX2bis]VXC00099.1 putative Mini-circle uncharacterized 19.1 kDa protein [Nocardioides sp. AX2bis]
MSDIWTTDGPDPREATGPTRGEKACVVDYLRAYRLTLQMKCEGLDAEQLARRSVPPSSMSLLGLVRHLAKVEHTWARQCLEGQNLPRLYVTDDEPDADFDGAVADDAVVAEAWEAWHREVSHAEQVVERLDDLGALVSWHGDGIEVRDVLVHLVEEYARHVGHADLLRECVDGRTGQ